MPAPSTIASTRAMVRLSAMEAAPRMRGGRWTGLYHMGMRPAPRQIAFLFEFLRVRAPGSESASRSYRTAPDLPSPLVGEGISILGVRLMGEGCSYCEETPSSILRSPGSE